MEYKWLLYIIVYLQTPPPSPFMLIIIKSGLIASCEKMDDWSLRGPNFRHNWVAILHYSPHKSSVYANTCLKKKTCLHVPREPGLISNDVILSYLSCEKKNT